ncbi:protein Njmu-R1 [Protopterus annectens]|uniref:protein Njmu-R1 n=1 Tax=Protopterus annectens TaxID=7888 RepID=UPI001CFA0032|nr:protein Njmu-R1 [Protopterus annectens]
MYAIQTSFRESMDGDEKEADLDTDEGALDEGKTPRQTNSYYCLYLYSCNRSRPEADNESGSNTRTTSTSEVGTQDGFSLSLSDTNLPAAAEPELQSVIAKRLGKGTIFGGIGHVVSVELSVPEQTVGCYYCLLQDLYPKEPETKEVIPDYVICFLGGTEKGLELFRLELDKYTQGLQSYLNPEMNNLESCVRPYLTKWFEECVLHVQRVAELFQTKISILLHAALSYTPVEVQGNDDRIKKDIDRFLNAASLQGLLHESTMASLSKAVSEEQPNTVLIDCTTPQPQFQNAGNNRFCEEWVQSFVHGAESSNPFLLRQILENFKLKAIQDMNNLKRFLRQAEMNHYALFKCYMFLRNCGNADVLLQNVKVENAEMPEAKNVVNVLEDFMYEQGIKTPSV